MVCFRFQARGKVPSWAGILLIGEEGQCFPWTLISSIPWSLRMKEAAAGFLRPAGAVVGSLGAGTNRVRSTSRPG